MRPDHLFRGACWVILLAAIVSCGGNDREESLARLLPSLDPAAVGSLAAPGDPAYGEFLAATNTDALIEMRRAVVDTLHHRQGLAAAERARLGRLQTDLDRELEQGRGLPEYAADSRYLAGLPPAAAARIVAARAAVETVFADEGLAPEAKAQRIQSLQTELLAADDRRGALASWSYLSVLEMRRQRWEEAMAVERRCLEESRRAGDLVATSRSWGQWLMFRMRWGWTDAERDTLNDLTERALAAGLAGTTSYLMTMQAYDAYNTGRYAGARTRFETAIGVCRELGAPTRALPTMSILLRMYAGMGCWKRVDELLLAANLLLDEKTRQAPPTLQDRLTRVRHDALAARVLAARRRFDQAQEAFATTFAAATELPYAEAKYVGRLWFETMMENERPDLAAGALAELKNHLEAGPPAPDTKRLHLWQAQIAWSRGDAATARAALDRFVVEGLEANPRLFRTSALFCAALDARIRWAAEPDSAAAVLGRAWSRFAARAAAREPSPEAYLDLALETPLRRAAHDLLGSDPVTDYGLEILWRSLFLPRNPEARLEADDDLAAAARRQATRAMARLHGTGAVHCVYQIRGEAIIRWTVDGDGAERTALAISTSALRERVVRTLERMAQAPADDDAGVAPELAAELGDLAAALLPARFFAPSERPATLLVSGEGFLNQLPFAPLDLGAGRYEPLGATVDVAWLRLAPSGRTPPAAGAALIVAAPELSAVTRRRFSIDDDLPGAVKEQAAVSARFAQKIVLAGPDATRTRFLDHAPAASMVYFIGHAVSDPHTPLASWLPLAAAGPDDAYPGLDIKDILSTPLSGCGLAVLSGCATGAPYVDGFATAPSLGDAFLDAGAGAAIQTFWPVRDENPYLRPERILASWQEDGDLVAAVAEERRRAMALGEGYRHPFDWAAWSVKLGRW